MSLLCLWSSGHSGIQGAGCCMMQSSITVQKGLRQVFILIPVIPICPRKANVFDPELLPFAGSATDRHASTPPGGTLAPPIPGKATLLGSPCPAPPQAQGLPLQPGGALSPAPPSSPKRQAQFGTWSCCTSPSSHISSFPCAEGSWLKTIPWGEAQGQCLQHLPCHTS